MEQAVDGTSRKVDCESWHKDALALTVQVKGQHPEKRPGGLPLLKLDVIWEKGEHREWQ